MTRLETVCQRGHVEFVDSERFAEAGRVCFRRAKDGVFCDAPIVNVFAEIEEQDDVRPGPDDSVATEVDLLLDQKVTIIQQIETVAQMLLDRGISLTEDQAHVVHLAMEAAGEALPRVQDLIRRTMPLDDEFEDEMVDDEDLDDIEDDDLLDDEPVRVPFLQRALQPLAFLLPYRPWILAAAAASAALTLCLAATGHWILALLV